MSRKQAIKAAAVELFATKGYNATSTAEVAALAGVSEGTIFYHFKTKQGIMHDIFEHAFELYMEQLEQILEQSPNGLVALRGFMQHHFSALQEPTKEMILLVRDFPGDLAEPNSRYLEMLEAKFQQQTDLFVRAIREGQADGSIRPCKPLYQALLLKSLLRGITMLAAKEGGSPPFDIGAIAQEALDMLDRGLSSQS